MAGLTVKMTAERRRLRVTMAKTTLVVLLIYLLINWVWINVTTLSNAQQFNNIDSEDGESADNDDINKYNDDDAGDKSTSLSVLDTELEAAVRLIERDPVVNAHQYKFIVNNEQLCTDSIHGGLAPGERVTRRRVFLLVYVHSAPGNYAKRLLLRQTWANPSLYDDQHWQDIRVVFLIGRRSTDSGVLDQAVRLEATQFRDIVVVDFEDSYRNLTYKAMSALAWISRYCNKTRYVLKTDDDAYVNMRALIRHLGDIHRNRAVQSSRRMILCRIWNNMPVLRVDPKWAVSRADYAPDVYPAYCSGIALLLSLDVVLALARIASRVPFFWVDDVFLTGILPARLSKVGVNVTWYEFGHAYIKMDKMETFDSPLWYQYIFVHLAEMNYFARMWTKMEAAAQRYPIPEVSKIVPGGIAGHKWTAT